MNLAFSLLFLTIIIVSILNKKHNNLFLLSILSVFSDIFHFEFGASVLLINFIGFLIIPLVLNVYVKQYYSGFGKRVSIIFRPLFLNLFYLIILGVIFGFLIPWSDETIYRSWAQRPQGRTIVTLIRYSNELFVLLYVIWVISTNRVSLKFIINTIGWMTFISFIVGVVEFSFGPIIRSLIQDDPRILTSRFLGLCGEPKIFGRNSALSYIILIMYYIKIERNKKLLFFILISAIGVILSLSASAFIMFALFNMYILFEQRKFKYVFLSIIIFTSGSFALNNVEQLNPTKYKIEKALTGTDEFKTNTSEDSIWKSTISRFDIFDHLALLFLIENPSYIITGTGPNLISIPASKNVADYARYRTYAEIGGIDSVPNVMFNNVLSSSGIIGVLLYIIFFKRLYAYSKYDSNNYGKDLVVIALIFNMIFFSVVLLFLTGIVIGIVNKQLIDSKEELANK